MAKRDDQPDDLWAVLARISDLLGVFTALIALGYLLVALYRSNWTLALDDILVTILIAASLFAGGVLLRMLLRRRRPPAEGDVLPRSVAERSRAQMLAKVRATWMPLLDESLQEIVRIELGLTSAAALVDDPRKRLRQPDRPERLLPRGTPIHAVFDELAGELLILGAPGAGKTTMLLELTRELLDRALHDATHAIPVVFNLSTWATAHPPITAWLVDELSKRYDVPRKLGQAWVDGGAILPLLDGLDEVALDQRAACVEAINAYHGAHGPLRLVVCSRSADYELLAVRLQLQGAVVIQPLAIDQIDAALAQAGDRLDGVRTAIRDDTVLQELATTPLLLSIMILAYRDHDSRSLAAFDTLDARRDHLFAAYVDAMFARRGEDSRYPRTTTLHWLAWLARGMVKHTQTVFYIEQLQPDWLPRRQRRRYQAGVVLSIGLVGGVVGGFVFGLVVGPIFGLVVGPIFGLGIGLTMGLIMGQAIELSDAQVSITIVEELRWSRAYAMSAMHHVMPNILRTGLAGGLAGALLGGQLVGLVGLVGALLGALLGALVGALVGGLGLVLLFGLSPVELPLKTVPNQGIRRSAWNALVFGLVGALVVEVLVGLVVGLLFGLLFGLVGALVGALVVGLVGALVVGLLYGGFACLQHLVLRILIWRNSSAPWNYAAFLDSAADRILLRKVGGGYIFIHRMLMEYFAALEGDANAG